MQVNEGANERDPIGDLRAELRSNPRELQNYLQLGWAEYGQKDYTGAKETLESAQERFPDHYEVTYLLALTLKKMGEVDRAAELFGQIEEQVEKLDNPIRGHMLVRFAKGQRNMIEKGNWDFDVEET